MSFKDTLLNGEEGKFKPESLTPMQKLLLRFVVVGLVYYGFAVIEGMIMRMYAIEPISAIPDYQYFAILTAHPLVGIFGSTYSLVFGAFSFLVPFLMKKPLWSYKLANWTFLRAYHFRNLYFLVLPDLSPIMHRFIHLYWPLPADFTQFSAMGGTFFMLGIALVMVGTVFFVINIFKTIMYTPEGWEKQPAGKLIGSALGVQWIDESFQKKDKQKEHLVSLPVAAIARGTVDIALNAGIILFTGVLILVYMVGHLTGIRSEKYCR